MSHKISRSSARAGEFTWVPTEEFSNRLQRTSKDNQAIILEALADMVEMRMYLLIDIFSLGPEGRAVLEAMSNEDTAVKEKIVSIATRNLN